jgi:hypothetical protein
MEHSILTTLSAVHATILSIVAAVAITFYFYATEKVDTLNEKLNNAREEIGQLMTLPPMARASSIDYLEYLKDGHLDLERVKNRILLLSGVTFAGSEDKTGPNLNLSREQRGDELVDLLSLFSTVNPYANRLVSHPPGGWKITGHRRTLYDEKWKRRLLFINSLLSWNRTAILECVTAYDRQEQKRHAAVLEEGKPFFVSPAQFAEGFFRRTDAIGSRYLPEIEENSARLTFYQDRFKIKQVTTIVLIAVFALMIVGVILPLILNLYLRPPYLETVQLGLLVVTMLPYLALLVWMLRYVLKMPLP